MKNPIHILVAEDDNDISRLFSALLRKAGTSPSRRIPEQKRFYT